jgi:DNA-binding LytR/AlgR family response regulator
MNVLMIEQEKERVQKIKDLLSEIDESIRIVGTTDNISAAAEWLSRNQAPDLILANRDMTADIGKKGKREIKALVTFSTNTEEFNLRAFHHKSIRNFSSDIPQTDERSGNIDDYPGKPLFTGSFKERFLVKQGQKLLSIPVSQIAYFFSEERFIFFRTFDNQKFLSEYRIEQLEQLLSPDRFFRINRSFVISLPTVKEIHSWFGNRLKLYLSPSTDKEVIVSRKRVNEFKEWLGK